MREVPAALDAIVAGVTPVELLHDAFETTTAGMVMLDLEGKICYTNSAYCELFGYSPEDLMHRSFLSLKHPDDRAEAEECLAALQSGERETFHMENRSLAKGGAVLWVHVRASLLRGRDRAPHAIMAVIEDVTRQHEMERARRELHREREALLDSAVEGIYGVDLSGCCTFVNRAAAEMLGYTREEMLGKQMHALVHAKHPDGRPYPAEECAIVQAFRHAGSAAGKLRNFEQTLWRKDGSPVQVEHSAEAVVVDEDVRGTVVTLHDVTGRNARRAERRAMLEQEQTLRQRAEQLNGALESKEHALRAALAEQMQVLEAIPQMVWVTGATGDLEFMNARWHDFTGSKAGAPVSSWPAYTHPEDQAWTAARFAESRRSGTPYEAEHRMRYLDGSYRWVLARALPMMDEGGNVVRWFGTSTDVHDRKATEDLLLRTERLAAAGRLAGTVAHEINNPLEAVQNLIYLAQHDPLVPATAEKYLQVASEELQRVGRIVSQTLGFYREVSAPRRTHLAGLVEEVLTLYQRKLEGRQIRVSRSLEDEAAAEIIPGEVRQVIANLVLNSIDAMEPYGVLAVEVVAESGFAQVVISDTGHGISAPVLAKIFEPFFTTKRDTGTGLGLWVSKGIVEKYGGRLEVTSSQAEEDHGTAFVLSLPAA